MTSISVLGGGISGLSAAFHLARRFPPASGARLTLVERGDRLGGWIRAERVRVKDTREHRADMVLESGPRTLRPNSNAILELVSAFSFHVVTYTTFLSHNKILIIDQSHA